MQTGRQVHQFDVGPCASHIRQHGIVLVDVNILGPDYEDFKIGKAEGVPCHVRRDDKRLVNLLQLEPYLVFPVTSQVCG
jgi:hypothetical protein